MAPLWREFRKCYPSEQLAIAAARKNIVVLMPFINTASNIRFNKMVLADELGFSEAEILDLITKNPGILGNVPYQLAASSKSEVVFSAKFVSLFDALPTWVQAAIPVLTGVSIVAVIAKRLIECKGTCG